MQKRSIVVLVLVFAALLAYVLVVEVGREDEREEQEALEAQVIQITAEAVRRVRLERSGVVVEIERRGDVGEGEWFLVEPFEAPADPAAARGLARAAATVEERRLIEQPSEDASQYGMEQPELVVVIEADGLDAPVRLTFGGETGAKDGRYLRLDDEPLLRIAPSYQYRSLDKTVDDLRDRRLVRFSTGAVVAVTLSSGDAPPVELARRDGVWRLGGEPGYRASRADVDDLLADLTTTRAKRFVDADDPALGLADTDRWIRVGLDDGSVVEVDFGRESADAVVAQVRGADEAVELGTFVLDALGRGAEQWRSAEVADINPWTVSRLVFDYGGRTFELASEDDEWTLTEGDGKPQELAAERARELLSTIDQLKATGWLAVGADPGPQVGAFEITTEGAPLVRFTLHRSGDAWVAAVDGDPAPMSVPDTLGLFLEGFLADPAGDEG